MNNRKKGIVVIIACVVVLVIALVVHGKKKKEGYAEIMIAPSYDDFMVSRPTFKADLSPRFDPYRMGGGYIKTKYPAANQQAAGITPLSDSEGNWSDSDVSREGYDDEVMIEKDASTEGYAAFSSNGNYPTEVNFSVSSANGVPVPAADNKDFVSIGLDKAEDLGYAKGCSALKEDAVTKFKSSMGYADPEELLPTPDIRSCLKDPSDPLNYMYDRTIFAPLKRRNANVFADYIRGDLAITPNRFGWFDTPAIPSVDLVKGAMSILSGASIDSEDALYQTARPLMTKSMEEQMKYDEEVLPWGDLSFHMP